MFDSIAPCDVTDNMQALLKLQAAAKLWPPGEAKMGHRGEKNPSECLGFRSLLMRLYIVVPGVEQLLF